MKKLILGCSIFICGLMSLFTDYTVTRIIDSMPDTHITSSGALFSLSAAGLLAMAAGAALALSGLLDGQQNGSFKRYIGPFSLPTI